MKPWDENFDDYGREAILEEACKATVGSDYYFCVAEDEDGENILYVTPKELFDRDGTIYDDYLDIEHIIGNDISNLMEGTWDFGCTPEEMRERCLKAGMLENEQFTSICSHWIEK